MSVKNYRFIYLILLAGSALAQSPTITDVITSGPRDHTFAPGTSVYILGSFTRQSAGRDYTVTVGGQSGGINVADDAYFITAPIPITAPTGSQMLTVTYQGHVSNSYPVTILPIAPEIEGAGVLVNDALPIAFSPYYPFQDANTGQRIKPTAPAARGEALSVGVYGLGANNSMMPTITVGDQNAQIAKVQAGAAGRATYYFFVPNSAPLGIDPVVVTVNGVASNTASLPVGTTPTVGAVLNGASFGSPSSVAPGSIVSIFGAGFGSQDNLSPFPSTNPNGVTVLFGSTPAPVFALAAAEGQINVLVPDELPTTGSINLTVQTSAGTSQVFPLTLAPSAPGIFYFADPLVTTRRNAIAVVVNTARIAMPVTMATNLGLPSNCSVQPPAALCGQPAHPGDYIQIYATGLGIATPNGDPGGAVLPTGSVAPSSGNPLYLTVTTPTVTIGGLTASVVFSGIAPGYAGFYQIDAQIPSGVPAGDDVPLQISVGNASDSATMAIAN